MQSFGRKRGAFSVDIILLVMNSPSKFLREKYIANMVVPLHEPLKNTFFLHLNKSHWASWFRPFFFSSWDSVLTEYFFISDFDWISGAMSLNFIQCSTSISYTIFTGCLTVRFDLSDYHVTYGIQCLCSFVILCGRQFSNVRQPSVDKPTLMT